MQPAIITGHPSCSLRILANALIGAALPYQSTVDKATEEWRVRLSTGWIASAGIAGISAPRSRLTAYHLKRASSIAY